MGKRADTPRGFRAQVGALVMREAPDKPEVLLLTSRDTGRWVIPKGWPMKGKPDHRAAAEEAREEAGVVGRVHRSPLGTYSYCKRQLNHFELCRVTVYLVAYERQKSSWREKGQRQAEWFGLVEAATLVREPELAALFLAAEAVVRRGGPLPARSRHLSENAAAAAEPRMDIFRSGLLRRR